MMRSVIVIINKRIWIN